MIPQAGPPRSCAPGARSLAQKQEFRHADDTGVFAGLACVRSLGKRPRLLEVLDSETEGLACRPRAICYAASVTAALSRRAARRSLLVLASLAAGLVVLRTAWVSDDAFITFRTIENAASGLGLRWNAAERVQTYTHPLWLLLLGGARTVTSDLYRASLVLSIALSLLTIWTLASRLAVSTLAGLGVVAIGVSSRAFVDYSTSGLENPLSHALLAALIAFIAAVDHRPAIAAGAIAGLCAVTRHDLILLAWPPALMLLRHARRDVRPALAVAVVPIAAWTAFSLVYYGFPFPNTAYAKLQTGASLSALAPQGLRYFMDSLARDYVTLPVIALSLVPGTTPPTLPARAARAGLASYLLYVLLIGGDFMSGRFLSAPFTVALALLTSGPLLRTSGRAVAVGASALAIGLIVPHPNLTSGTDFGLDQDEAIADTGIADERLVYFQDTGWFQRTHSRPPAPPDWVTEDIERYGGQWPRTVQRKAVGYFGWLAGPRVHVIDQLGLGDPLLARLPAEPAWRIGHFERAVPAGYFESVDAGRNAIDDPDLRAYYDRLALVTRGPIWSLPRVRAIAGLNLGRFDHWLEAYAGGRRP